MRIWSLIFGKRRHSGQRVTDEAGRHADEAIAKLRGFEERTHRRLDRRHVNAPSPTAEDRRQSPSSRLDVAMRGLSRDYRRGW